MERVPSARVPIGPGSSGAPGGSTGPTAEPTVFVYRPGGVASGNIYTDWATLYADYLTTDGPVTIEFDDEFVSPAVVPAGTYGFRDDTVLQGILRQSASGAVQVNVQLDDGVVFDPPPATISTGLALISVSSSPIISIAPTGGSFLFDFILIEKGSRLFANGSAPFIEVTRLQPEGGLFVIFSLGGSFESSTVPVLSVQGDVNGAVPAIVGMNMFAAGNVGADTIQTNAQGFVTATVDATSVFDLNQPSYTGLIPLREAVQVDDRSFQPTTIFTALTIGTLQVQGAMTIRCDPTAGGFNIQLPSISSVEPGEEIIIKNVTVSPNALTVLPSGADTVDGAPNLILAGPRAVVRLQADGTSDWMAV